MPAISAIFLVLALVLAVLIGPQTRPWTWGPAMLALGMSVIAALPVIWKRGKAPADFAMLAFGALTLTWFAWRAWISPVAEFGHADLLLVGGVVGAFVCVRATTGHKTAETILAWGMALLLLANLVVIGMQLADPSYSPIFRSRASERMVSGFFAHYNEAANYLIASSMLVGAAAMFGQHSRVTRCFWLLIAVAGLAAVWFTRSRGGILGAATACGVFALVLLIIGKKREARWFAPTLIAIPVIGLGIGAFLLHGWQEAQESRGVGNGFLGVLDNDIRLYLLGLALECIGMHPMSGGGSHSFSWECHRVFDSHIQKHSGNRPEFVHNELLQAATDYGLVGAGLLSALLVALVLTALLRAIFNDQIKREGTMDVWLLGGLAALAGMMTQSCFSFVFHLMPGILLLGICLGMISGSPLREGGPKTLGVRLILSLASIFCIVLLLPAGWKGGQLIKILWPTYFSKQASSSDESRLDALTEAIQIWPQAAFYQERAALFQKIAASTHSSDFPNAAERAISDYQTASELHPYDPGLAINRANILSQLQRDPEAEEWYLRAIQLQGGMEPGFRGHFSLANHYLRKGLRLFDPKQPDAAHDALELAAEHMESAVKKMHWVIADMRNPRVSVHESLGAAREAVNDREGALLAYDFASGLYNGTRAHYRAGVLIGKMAVEAWSKRQPAEAMAKFIEARRRVGLARELPEGVTPSESAEFTAYLDRTIAFLKGAKVEPAKAGPQSR